MKKAGHDIDPADYPPAMQWESAVWLLYLRMCTQWRTGKDGKHIGLDYNPVITLMERWGWDIDLGLSLLQVIELESLYPTREDGELIGAGG